MALRTTFPGSSRGGGYQPSYQQQYRVSFAQVDVPIHHYLTSVYVGIPAVIAAITQTRFNTKIVSFRIDTINGAFVAQGTRHYFQGAALPYNVCGDPTVAQALKQDPQIAV